MRSGDGNRVITYLRQERNAQTHSLCRMNMFLHGIDDAIIAWGDTLANPIHPDAGGKLMKFQVVVANPPFSLDKWAMGFAAQADDKFTYLATKEEIAENDFNLNIPRYVDTFEEEAPVNMDAVKENIYRVESELAQVKEKMGDYLKELGL
ncbi:MAG: N-6 DNA methylase [bacterium]|nr:N-6 DNA methylase [bacterium]